MKKNYLYIHFYLFRIYIFLSLSLSIYVLFECLLKKPDKKPIRRKKTKLNVNVWERKRQKVKSVLNYVEQSVKYVTNRIGNHFRRSRAKQGHPVAGKGCAKQWTLSTYLYLVGDPFAATVPPPPQTNSKSCIVCIHVSLTLDL